MRDVPSDYYQRLHAIERDHWWQVGMREVTAALVEPLLAREGSTLLDAGCGTGGFLVWAAGTGAFRRLCGVDVSPEAIALAREAVPGAELHVAPLHEVPFRDGELDLVVTNDVLQHVHEDDVRASLGELRRVLRPGGTLVVRTNGGRKSRRERPDWRLYDDESLADELRRAGFAVERVTHANALLSLVARLRQRAPSAPSTGSCGIPAPAGPTAQLVGRVVLSLEARYLRRPASRLPYGHTLFAVAHPGGPGVARATGPVSGGLGRAAEVAEFFDSFGDAFDSAYESRGAGGRTLRRRLAAVLELVGPGPGEVLDAGMGGGVVCQQLERRGWSVAGVDISPRMVELAHLRLPHLRERLVEGSILALPFDDGRFDAVVVTGVLEYVEGALAPALAEVSRVLRPGGAAVVSLPNYGSVQSAWRFRVFYPSVRLLKRALGRKLPPSRRIVGIGELRSALAAAGLAVERVDIVGVRMLPNAVGERLEGSRSRLLRLFGTQFVVRARKEAP